MPVTRATAATMSETRDPYATRLKMSLPTWSVQDVVRAASLGAPRWNKPLAEVAIERLVYGDDRSEDSHQHEDDQNYYWDNRPASQESVGTSQSGPDAGLLCTQSFDCHEYLIRGSRRPYMISTMKLAMMNSTVKMRTIATRTLMLLVWTA